jgi:hypothetical protein
MNRCGLDKTCADVLNSVKRKIGRLGQLSDQGLDLFKPLEKVPGIGVK